ncbi:hypothetical protein FACS1894217_12570 [Clostridia bacterium]|nr:hypothetical protein FACS1894217_12570 [Clostridia bacterium]
MAKFDLKTFNPNAFGKYVDIIPKVRKNELIKSRALQPNSQIKAAFSNQTGVVYATLPMFGRLDGEPLNYDGETDITATSTTTYERGVVVIGRAKAWVERDFSEDITGGAGFMSNVARQVSEYWEDVDQDTLVAILNGIFSMTGTANAEFVQKHTFDISAQAAGSNVVGAATLNTAIQQASGDKKNGLPPNASWDINATNQRMEEIGQKIAALQSVDLSMMDDVSVAPCAIRALCSVVYGTLCFIINASNIFCNCKRPTCFTKCADLLRLNTRKVRGCFERAGEHMLGVVC